MGTRTDIEILPGNTKGSDYILGDVHGAIKTFKKIANSVGKNDRLMIVGDLTDRGEDSAAVLDTIIEINQKIPGQIIAIRGNHEDMLLKYLETRLLMHKKLERGDSVSEAELLSYQTDVAHYRKNGGSWVIDNDTISIEKLKSYRDYIQSLPYIIHVDDKNPYHIVHADMPFSDDVLAKRIKQDRLTLSAEEIQYATWSRLQHDKVPIKDVGRTSTSIPVYCGHTILEGMRTATNSINLDVGSYMTDYMMVVNHTKQTVGLLSEQQKKLDDDMEYVVNYIFKHTDLHLKNAICVNYRARYQQSCEYMQAEFESLVQLQSVFGVNHLKKENEQIQETLTAATKDDELPVFIKQAFLNELWGSIQNDKNALISKIHHGLCTTADEWLNNKAEVTLQKRGSEILNKLNLIHKNNHLTPTAAMAALKNVLDLSNIYRLMHEIETIDRLYEIKYRQKIPPQAKDEKITPVIKLVEKVQIQLDHGAKTYASMYEDLQKALDTCKDAILAQQPYRFFGKKQQQKDKERLVSMLDEVKSRHTYRF